MAVDMPRATRWRLMVRVVSQAEALRACRIEPAVAQVQSPVKRRNELRDRFGRR